MTGYIMLDAPNRAAPQGTYPRRGGHKPSGTCIVHTSEGNWRNGVDSLTRLVQTRADYGCYHRACDWADIAKYYPWEWETWQDTETNNWAVGIAAACKASDWPTMPADIREGYYRNLARMAADFVVYMRDTHRVTVPLRRLTGAEARNRVPGFCAHGDSGIHRSDPGPAFDWALFFKYTSQALGGTITTQSTTPTPAKPKGFLMALTDAQQDELYKTVKNTWAGVWAGGSYNGKKFNYGILPIVAHSQHLEAVRNAETQAQLKGLIGALAALSKGEPFDQAKLLSGIQSAAEAGVKAGLADGVVTVDVNIQGK